MNNNNAGLNNLAQQQTSGNKFQAGPYTNKKRKPSYGRRRRRKRSSGGDAAASAAWLPAPTLGQPLNIDADMAYTNLLKFAEGYVKLNDNYLVGSYI